MRFAGAVTAALFGLSTACYSTGDGTAPPLDQLYFPTGLAVSPGGHVLYVANSDFDLQFNGGTLQSYDLEAIRVASQLQADAPPSERCLSPLGPDGQRLAGLGEACAPPIDSTVFIKDSVITGAFATDLQLAVEPPARAKVPSPVTKELVCEGDELPVDPDRVLIQRESTGQTTRLFVPIRGDTSITWADVARDVAGTTPPSEAFVLQCTNQPRTLWDRASGKLPVVRCDDDHRAGARGVAAPTNTRNVSLPGEPFGMAQSPDGRFIALTHQTEKLTSLFSTGYQPGVGFASSIAPALQFVASDITVGGNGIAAIPLDPTLVPATTSDATVVCPGAQRPAFLETTRAAAEIQLLRVYDDQGLGPADFPGVGSDLKRPFLVKESTFNINTNSGGADSRGVVIDPSPRFACKLAAKDAAERAACARRPSRIFIANRTPASLIVGEVGESPLGTADFDPTRVRLHTSIPLSAGPSRVYLAPVVDRERLLSLRVFVVCYDANVVFVINPDTLAVENIIRVAPGPFAMAFDPFSLYEVVARRQLGKRLEPDAAGVLPYRFAYVASFLRSYMQVLDLDVSRTQTFQTVVYTLGFEKRPKGTK